MVSLYKVGERRPCCFHALSAAVINEELGGVDLSCLGFQRLVLTGRIRWDVVPLAPLPSRRPHGYGLWGLGSVTARSFTGSAAPMLWSWGSLNSITSRWCHWHPLTGQRMLRSWGGLNSIASRWCHWHHLTGQRRRCSGRGMVCPASLPGSATDTIYLVSGADAPVVRLDASHLCLVVPLAPLA